MMKHLKVSKPLWKIRYRWHRPINDELHFSSIFHKSITNIQTNRPRNSRYQSVYFVLEIGACVSNLLRKETNKAKLKILEYAKMKLLNSMYTYSFILPNLRLDVQPKLLLLWYPASLLFPSLRCDLHGFQGCRTFLLPSQRLSYGWPRANLWY